MTHTMMKQAGRWFLIVLAGLASAGCVGSVSSADAPGAGRPQVAVSRKLTERTEGLRIAESPQGADESAEEGQVELKLRRVRQDELSAALIEKAVEILNATRGKPLGTQVAFELEGKHYVAKTEHHYREPGSAKRPWGLHRGVSMFVAEPVS